MSTAGVTARTILLGLEQFDGDVPAEISDLVRETKVDAEMVVEAAADAYEASGCEYLTESAECTAKTGGLMAPLGFLSTTAQNWDPYL